MDKAALVERYKHRSEIYLDHRVSLIDPVTIDDMTRLTFWGSSIRQKIKELQAAIETLQAYDQLLHDRAQEILTAPWHPELHLTREKNYATGKIIYRLSLLKVYDIDGISPEIIEQTNYPGTERHKAIAAFRAAQKQRPGITARMAIEKSRWE